MEILHIAYFLLLIGYSRGWEYGFPPQEWNKLPEEVIDESWPLDLEKKDFLLLVALPKERYDGSTIDPAIDKIIMNAKNIERIQHQYKKLSIQYIFITQNLQSSECPGSTLDVSQIKAMRKTAKRGKYGDIFMNIYSCPKSWGDFQQMNTLLVLADYIPIYKLTPVKSFMKRKFFYPGEIHYYVCDIWRITFTIIVATPDTAYYWFMDLRKLQFKFFFVMTVDSFILQDNPFKFLVGMTEKYARPALTMQRTNPPYDNNIFIPSSIHLTYMYQYRTLLGYNVKAVGSMKNQTIHHYFFLPDLLTMSYKDVIWYFDQVYFWMDYKEVLKARLARFNFKSGTSRAVAFRQSNSSTYKIFATFPTDKPSLSQLDGLKYTDLPDYDTDYNLLLSWGTEATIDSANNKIKIVHLFLRNSIARVMSKYYEDTHFLDTFYDTFVNLIVNNYSFIFWSEEITSSDSYHSLHTRQHHAWFPFWSVGTMMQAIEASIKQQMQYKNVDFLVSRAALSLYGKKKLSVLIIIPKHFTDPFFAGEVMTLLSPQGYFSRKMKKKFNTSSVLYSLAHYGSADDPMYGALGDCSLLQLRVPSPQLNHVKYRLNMTTSEKPNGALAELYRCANSPYIFNVADSDELKYAILISEAEIRWQPGEIIIQHYRALQGPFKSLVVSIAGPDKFYYDMLYNDLADETLRPPEAMLKSKAVNDADKLGLRVKWMHNCYRLDLCAALSLVQLLSE